MLRRNLVHIRGHVPSLGLRVFCLPNDRPLSPLLGKHAPCGVRVARQRLVRDVARSHNRSHKHYLIVPPF